MKNFKIQRIDCIGMKCKNVQKINTIEMYFYITIDDMFAIEYNFHSIDFNFWKEIIEIHKEDVIDPILYDPMDEVIFEGELKNTFEYYTFTLISKDFNLYRNINLIMYLEDNAG